MTEAPTRRAIARRGTRRAYVLASLFTAWRLLSVEAYHIGRIAVLSRKFGDEGRLVVDDVERERKTR